MKILVLLFSLFSVSTYSLHIDTTWTEDSKKYLNITCDGEAICEQFCSGGSCKMQEKVCKNCVGTSIGMTFAFQEMGRSYIATEKLDDYFIFDLFWSKKFVTLTSRSIYNLVERFDSMGLRRKFRSLCADGTRYPVVFFGTQESGELGEIKAVWCQEGVFQMEQIQAPNPVDNLY
ncbi:MAG: hypothetical protein NXH75_03690 [Halobacteriovoraceae bacterium]|nr:hypothetical protein [Halobacteriovoraceae bacterium]